METQVCTLVPGLLHAEDPRERDEARALSLRFGRSSTCAHTAILRVTHTHTLSHTHTHTHTQADVDEEVPDELAGLVVHKSADPDLSSTSEDYPESLDSSTGEELSRLKQVSMCNITCSRMIYMM